MGDCLDNVGNIYSTGCLDLKTVQQNVKSIEIKATAKKIYGVSDKDFAFIKCKDTISEVTFPKGSLLETISPYSFYCCSKITKIDLSNCTKLTEIGSYAFNQCSELSTLTFPSSIITIKSYSFSGTKISSLFIPKSVKTIESAAFYAIPLTKVEFEEGIDLKTLPWRAFGWCSLTTFTIPDSVDSFSAACLENSRNIEEIKTVANSKYVVTNGSLFTNNHENLVYFPPCYCYDTYTIPSGTKQICYDAFLNSNAKKIIIPDSVTTIGSYAFIGAAFKTLTLPDSVTSIGSDAFRRCISLINITLSSALTSLADSLFENCVKFQSFIIPEKITSIGNSCFKGCTALKDVVLPSSLTTIGANAFSECINLRSINIPLSVSSVGANAFYRCNSLACGQSILNTSISFRQSLISNAKLPKRCIIDCSFFHTIKNCRYQTSNSFMTYIMLIIISS